MVPAGMRPDSAMNSDAGEEHVAEFTTILVDLDSGDTDGKLRWVETHIGPATMVVYSGGTTDSGHPKLHVYFALTEPTAETARVGRLRHVLAGKCGGAPAFPRITQIIRSDARRVGNEYASTCSIRWSPDHSKTKTRL